MKHLLGRKNGFTLIELLISTVVFIVVALLATSTLVSTIRMQSTHKQSQNIVLQAKSVLSAIQYDIQASGSNTLLTYAFRDTRLYAAAGTPLVPAATPDDDALIVVVPVRAADGSALPTTETHVYCAELQNANPVAHTITGKRMVRYVISSAYTYSSARASLVPINICGPAFIQQAFLLAGVQPSIEYLSDSYFAIHNLRFWPAWSSAASTPSLYDVNPDGIRTELVVQYSIGNGSGAIETRVSDSKYAPPPLVFRTLTGRKKSYKINN